MADSKGHLAQAFEDYLISSNDYGVRTTERKFYLSDMGKCLRTRFLKRKGIESTFDPHVYWVLQIGNLYHDYAYKALEAKGLLIMSEDYVEDDHFRGRFDGITTQADGKKLQLVDLKSAGSWKVKKALEGVEDEFYVAQIMGYIKMLRESTNPQYAELKGLDLGSILYINKEPKDDLPIIAHQSDFHYTKMREEKIQDEMDRLVDYWEKDEVPPCTCPAWMKRYNSYLPFCSAPASKVKDWTKNLENGGKIITSKGEIVAVDKDGKEKILA